MLKRHLPAALIFLALTAILTNPLILHLWNAVEDKQDALLNTWIIAWVGHAAITDPLNLFNTNIFYPYPNTLAFSEILVPQGLLALPFTLATDNPILGYNLVLFAMLWLNAFAMYLLALDWTGNRTPGWVAGAIYAFSPFNLGNLAQIQLLSLGWMPLAILYLRRVVGRRGLESGVGRIVRDAILFAFFFVLQSLSSIYFALLAGFAVVTYLAVAALAQIAGHSQSRPMGSVPLPGHDPGAIDKDSRRRNDHSSPTLRRIASFVCRASPGLQPRIWALLFSLILIGTLLVPFLLPYFEVQRELGFQRSVQDSEQFSANLHQFIEVPPQNVVYGNWLAPNPLKFNGGYPLDNLFPGILALVLAGIGVAARRSRENLFLVILLACAFLLSLGPRLYLTADEVTNLALPYRWLYDFIPLLRALRAPVRFDALIMFALSLLAGIGMAALSVGEQQRALALAAVGLIAIEYLAVPAANITVLPVASEVSTLYGWLARQPASVVLELPMMGPNAQNQLDISNQYFSTYHWQKTPDGYSGFIPAGRGEIAYEMEDFPNLRAVSLMQALGVRYLVLHNDQFAERNKAISQDRLEQFSGLVHAQDFGGASVYIVAPTQFDTSQLSKRLYLPQPARAGEPYTAYLILANSSSIPFAVKPTDRIELSARWSDGRTEQISIPIRLVTSEATVVPIRLQAPSRSGRFSLQIEADDSLIGRVRLGGDVQVGEESAQEIVIPAKVELQEALQAEYTRGSYLTVKLDWLALNKIDAYYSVSVRLVDSKGNKVVAVDRQPRVPTLLWTPDDVVPDLFELHLPDNLIPGEYRVELLMYYANSGASVLLLDQNLNPQETFTLGEFQVR